MTSLPRFSSGLQFRDLSAAELDELVRRVIRNSNFKVGPGLAMLETPDGRTISLANAARQPIGRRGVPVSAFVVKEVLTDALTCQPVDGGSDVTVLRDYLLQRTPFDEKQRGDEWFYYSGDKVSPDFTPILDGEGQSIIMHPDDNEHRQVFHFGPGRDANSDRVIESAIQRIVPSYFTGFGAAVPDDPGTPNIDESAPASEVEGFAGIAHSGPDIIYAAAIDEQTVNGVSASFVEITDREWVVASRVMLPGVLEGP